MEIDAAAAPRPQPGNGAHQRTLSRSGFAGDQQSLTRLHNHLSVADDRGAIIERDRKVVEAEDCVALYFAALDAADAVAALGALKPVERHHQRGNPPRARVPI